MVEDLHADVHRRLRSNQQRYTSGRRRLVEVLRDADRPLTTAEIFTEGGLAQSSAYRNLAVLEDCGIVHRVAGADEFGRYELAEGITDHHHHHLICAACGRVEDFTVSDSMERSLTATTRAVEDATGFRADQHRLDLVGRCADCR